MYQMGIKYTNISHHKTLQNLPKIGFLFLKIYHLATVLQPPLDGKHFRLRPRQHMFICGCQCNWHQSCDDVLLLAYVTQKSTSASSYRYHLHVYRYIMYAVMSYPRQLMYAMMERFGNKKCMYLCKFS
jgi:hypothetical protein